MVGRHSSFLVTKRSLRNSDSSTGRKLRQVVQTKNLDDTVGLSRREEQELNKALYASLQENRRCRILPGFVDAGSSLSGGHSIGSRHSIKGSRSNSDGCSTTTTVSSSSLRVSSLGKSLKGAQTRKHSLLPGCFLPKRLHRRTSLSVDESSQDSVRSSTSSQNGSKRKIHAQRKFAQGCSIPGIMTCNPVKFATPAVKMLSSRIPKTEDFLTFLCLRGSSILPAHLDFFNFSREEMPACEESSRSVSYTLKNQREGTPDSSSTSSGANEEVAEAANVTTPPMTGRSGGGLLAKRSAARASAGTPETARGIVSLRQGLQRKVSTSSSSSPLVWPSVASSCLLPVSELTNTPPSRYRNKFYFTPEKTPSPSKASGIRTGEFTPPSLFSSATHMSSTYKFSPLVCCPSKFALNELPFGSPVRQRSAPSSSSSLSSSPVCGASKRKRRLPISPDAATTKVTCNYGSSVPSFCVTKCTRLDGLDCLSPHTLLLPASVDPASPSSVLSTSSHSLKSSSHSPKSSLHSPKSSSHSPKSSSHSPKSSSHSPPQITNHASLSLTSHSPPQITNHASLSLTSHSPPQITNHASLSLTSHSPPQITNHASLSLTSHSPSQITNHASLSLTSHSSPQITNHASLSLTSHSSPQITNHASLSLPSDFPSLISPINHPIHFSNPPSRKQANQPDFQSPNNIPASSQFKHTDHTFLSGRTSNDTFLSPGICRTLRKDGSLQHNTCIRPSDPLGPSCSHLNTAHSDHSTNLPSICARSSQFDFRCLHGCSSSRTTNSQLLHAHTLPSVNSCILDCLHDHEQSAEEHCMCPNISCPSKSRDGALSSELLDTAINNCSDDSSVNACDDSCCRSSGKRDSCTLKEGCSGAEGSWGFCRLDLEQSFLGGRCDVEGNVRDVTSSDDYYEVVNVKDSYSYNSDESVGFGDFNTRDVNFSLEGENEGDASFPVGPTLRLNCSKGMRYNRLMSVRRREKKNKQYNYHGRHRVRHSLEERRTRKMKKKQYKYHGRHRVRHSLEERRTRKMKKKYCLVKEVPKVKIRIVRRHSVAADVATGKVQAKVVEAAHDYGPVRSTGSFDNASSCGDFQNEFLKMLQASRAPVVSGSAGVQDNNCHRKCLTSESDGGKSFNDFRHKRNHIVCPGTLYSDFERPLETSDSYSEDSDADHFRQKCSKARVINVKYRGRTQRGTPPEALADYNDHPTDHSDLLLNRNHARRMQLNTPSFGDKLSTLTSHCQQLLQHNFSTPPKIKSGHVFNKVPPPARESTNLADSITLRDKVISAFAKFKRKDIIASSIDATRSSYEEMDLRDVTRSSYEEMDLRDATRSSYEEMDLRDATRSSYEEVDLRDATRSSYEEVDFRDATRSSYEEIDPIAATQSLYKEMAPISASRDPPYKTPDNKSANTLLEVDHRYDLEDCCFVTGVFDDTSIVVGQLSEDCEDMGKLASGSGLRVGNDKCPGLGFRKRISDQGVVKNKMSHNERVGNEKQSSRERVGNDKQSSRERVGNDKQSHNERVGNDKQSSRERAGNDKQSHNERVGNDKQSHNERVGNSNQSHNERVGNDKQSHNKRVGNSNQSHNERVGNDKQSHNERVGNDQQSHNERVGNCKQSHNERVGNCNQSHNERVGKSNQSNNERVGNSNDSHNKRMVKYKQPYSRRARQVQQNRNVQEVRHRKSNNGKYMNPDNERMVGSGLSQSNNGKDMNPDNERMVSSGLSQNERTIRDRQSQHERKAKVRQSQNMKRIKLRQLQNERIGNNKQSNREKTIKGRESSIVRSCTDRCSSSERIGKSKQSHSDNNNKDSYASVVRTSRQSNNETIEGDKQQNKDSYASVVRTSRQSNNETIEGDKQQNKDSYDNVVKTSRQSNNETIEEDKQQRKDSYTSVVRTSRQSNNETIEGDKQQNKDNYTSVVRTSRQSNNETIVEDKQQNKDSYASVVRTSRQSNNETIVEDKQQNKDSYASVVRTSRQSNNETIVEDKQQNKDSYTSVVRTSRQSNNETIEGDKQQNKDNYANVVKTSRQSNNETIEEDKQQRKDKLIKGSTHFNNVSTQTSQSEPQPNNDCPETIDLTDNPDKTLAKEADGVSQSDNHGLDLTICRALDLSTSNSTQQLPNYTRRSNPRPEDTEPHLECTQTQARNLNLSGEDIFSTSKLEAGKANEGRNMTKYGESPPSCDERKSFSYLENQTEIYLNETSPQTVASDILTKQRDFNACSAGKELIKTKETSAHYLGCKRDTSSHGTTCQKRHVSSKRDTSSHGTTCQKRQVSSKRDTCSCSHRTTEVRNLQTEEAKSKLRKSDEFKENADAELPDNCKDNLCNVCKAKNIGDENFAPQNAEWKSKTDACQVLDMHRPKSDLSFGQLKVTQCVSICTQTDHQYNDERRQFITTNGRNTGTVITNNGHNTGTVITTNGHNTGTVITTNGHNTGTVITNNGHNTGTVITNNGHNTGTVITSNGHNTGTVITTNGHNTGTELELSLNNRSVKVQVGICDIDIPTTSWCQGKRLPPQGKDNKAYEKVITFKLRDGSLSDARMSGASALPHFQTNQDVNHSEVTGTSNYYHHAMPLQEAHVDGTTLHRNSETTNTNLDIVDARTTSPLCLHTTNRHRPTSSEIEPENTGSSGTSFVPHSRHRSRNEIRSRNFKFQTNSEMPNVRLSDKEKRSSRNQTHVVQVPADCCIACVIDTNMCGEAATCGHSQTSQEHDDSDDLIILEDDSKENVVSLCNDSLTVSTVCSEPSDGFVIDLSIHSRSDRSNSSSSNSCSVRSCSNSPNAMAIFDSNNSYKNINFSSCGEVEVEFECCDEDIFSELLDLTQAASRGSATEKDSGQDSEARNSAPKAVSDCNGELVLPACTNLQVKTSNSTNETNSLSPSRSSQVQKTSRPGPITGRSEPLNDCEILNASHNLASGSSHSLKQKSYTLQQWIPEISGVTSSSQISCLFSPKYDRDGNEIRYKFNEKSLKTAPREKSSLKQSSTGQGKQFTDENAIILHSYGSLNTGQGFALVNGQLQQCKILSKQQLQSDVPEPAPMLPQPCISDYKNCAQPAANACSPESNNNGRNDEETRQQNNSAEVPEQVQNKAALPNSSNRDASEPYRAQQLVLCQKNNNNRGCCGNKDKAVAAESSQEFDLSRRFQQVQISMCNSNQNTSLDYRIRKQASEFTQFAIQPKPHSKASKNTQASSHRKYLYVELSSPHYTKNSSCLKENVNNIQHNQKIAESCVYEKYSSVSRSHFNDNSWSKRSGTVSSSKPLPAQPHPLESCASNAQTKSNPASTSDRSILRSSYISDLVQNNKEPLNSSPKCLQPFRHFDYPYHSSAQDSLACLKKRPANNGAVSESTSDTRKGQLSAKPTPSSADKPTPSSADKPTPSSAETVTDVSTSKADQHRYFTSLGTAPSQDCVSDDLFTELVIAEDGGYEDTGLSSQRDSTLHQVIASSQHHVTDSLTYEASVPPSTSTNTHLNVTCPLPRSTNSDLTQSLSSYLMPPSEIPYNTDPVRALPNNESEENVLDVVMEELKIQIALLKEEIMRENQQGTSSSYSKSRSRKSSAWPKVSSQTKGQKRPTAAQRKRGYKYNMRPLDQQDFFLNRNSDPVVESYGNNARFNSVCNWNRVGRNGTDVLNGLASKHNFSDTGNHFSSSNEHPSNTSHLLCSRDYCFPNRERHLSDSRSLISTNQSILLNGNCNTEHVLSDRGSIMSSGGYKLSHRDNASSDSGVWMCIDAAEKSSRGEAAMGARSCVDQRWDRWLNSSIHSADRRDPTSLSETSYGSIGNNASSSRDYSTSRCNDAASNSRDYSTSRCNDAASSSRDYSTTRCNDAASSSRDYSASRCNDAASSSRDYSASRCNDAAPSSRDYSASRCNDAASSSRDYSASRCSDAAPSSRDYSASRCNDAASRSRDYSASRCNDAASSSRDYSASRCNDATSSIRISNTTNSRTDDTANCVVNRLNCRSYTSYSRDNTASNSRDNNASNSRDNNASNSRDNTASNSRDNNASNSMDNHASNSRDNTASNSRDNNASNSRDNNASNSRDNNASNSRDNNSSRGNDTASNSRNIMSLFRDASGNYYTSNRKDNKSNSRDNYTLRNRDNISNSKDNYSASSKDTDASSSKDIDASSSKDIDASSSKDIDASSSKDIDASSIRGSCTSNTLDMTSNSRNVPGNWDDSSRSMADKSRNMADSSRSMADKSRNVDNAPSFMYNVSSSKDDFLNRMDDTSRNKDDTSKNRDDITRNNDNVSSSRDSLLRNMHDSSGNRDDTSKGKHIVSSCRDIDLISKGVSCDWGNMACNKDMSSITDNGYSCKDYSTSSRDNVFSNGDKTSANRDNVSSNRDKTSANRDNVSSNRDNTSASQDNVSNNIDNSKSIGDNVSSNRNNSISDSVSNRDRSLTIRDAIFRSSNRHLKNRPRKISESTRISFVVSLGSELTEYVEISSDDEYFSCDRYIV